MRRKGFLMLVIAIMSFGLAAGCDNNDGPLEDLGEEIDEAVEDAGDEIEDATDN